MCGSSTLSTWSFQREADCSRVIKWLRMRWAVKDGVERRGKPMEGTPDRLGLELCCLGHSIQRKMEVTQ